jgi:hypothetical protein
MEAFFCTACILCSLPISLPIVSVEHTIQCEKANKGTIPSYPQPVRYCCKEGNKNYICCPPVNLDEYHSSQAYQGTVETKQISQRIMISSPGTPVKKLNFDIYSEV